MNEYLSSRLLLVKIERHLAKLVNETQQSEVEEIFRLDDEIYLLEQKLEKALKTRFTFKEMALAIATSLVGGALLYSIL